MEETEIINKIAEQFQEDCHKSIEFILAESEAKYQDATNVWTFRKLAEFELRLREIESTLKFNYLENG